MAAGSQRYMIAVVAETAGELWFHDSLDGSVIGTVKLGFLPHEIALSPDGRTAYVSNFGLQDYDETIGIPGSSISVVDIATMSETHRLFTYDAASGRSYHAPHGVKTSPDGTLLYVNVEQGTSILIFDLATRALVRVTDVPDPRDPDSPELEFPDPELTHNLLVSPDGFWLYSQSGANGLYKLTSDDGRELGHQALTSLHGLTFMPDNQHLLASGLECMWLIDPVTLAIVTTFKTPGMGQLLYSVPTPDGSKFVAPAVWSSSVVVVDAASGAVLATVVTGLDPVHVVISPDSAYAFVSNARSGFLSVINLTTYVVTQIPTGEGPNGLAICQYYPRPARNTLVFGTPLPLSGAEGPQGRELMAGYEFWKERVNAAGGLLIGGVPYQVLTTYLDTMSNDGQAGTLAARMLAGGVQFLLGTYPSGANLVAAQAAEQAQIPMVTSSGAADVIYNQGNKYVFGIMSPAAGYLTGSIDVALAAKPPAATVCILSCDDPAALADAQNTATLATARGLTIVQPPAGVVPPAPCSYSNGVLVYPHLYPTYDAIAKFVQTLAPDLVLVAGHLPESVGFVTSAAGCKLTPKGFSFSVGPSLPDFAVQLGNKALQMMGAAQWVPSYPVPGYDRFGSAAQFAADYAARYNLTSSYLSAGAAACGVIYERAFEAAGSIDPAKVRAALAATNTYTFFGSVELDARGLNSQKPILTVQIQAGGAGAVAVVLAPPADAGANAVAWPFSGWPSS